MTGGGDSHLSIAASAVICSRVSCDREPTTHGVETPWTRPGARRTATLDDRTAAGPREPHHQGHDGLRHTLAPDDGGSTPSFQLQPKCVKLGAMNDGPNTRFVLTVGAAGEIAPEIAYARAGSGLRPPLAPPPAVSGPVPLRATAAAQAQHVRVRRAKVHRASGGRIHLSNYQFDSVADRAAGCGNTLVEAPGTRPL